MKDLRHEVQSLCSYYRETFRPVLSGYGLTSELARLDGLTHDLEAGVVRLAPMKIGFLGESQVGKSSLVNALLDRLSIIHIIE